MKNFLIVLGLIIIFLLLIWIAECRYNNDYDDVMSLLLLCLSLRRCRHPLLSIDL